MPWIEDKEYQQLLAIEQEAAQIIREPLQAWSDAQAAAYDKLAELLESRSAINDN